MIRLLGDVPVLAWKCGAGQAGAEAAPGQPPILTLEQKKPPRPCTEPPGLWMRPLRPTALGHAQPDAMPPHRLPRTADSKGPPLDRAAKLLDKAPSTTDHPRHAARHQTPAHQGQGPPVDELPNFWTKPSPWWFSPHHRLYRSPPADTLHVSPCRCAARRWVGGRRRRRRRVSGGSAVVWRWQSGGVGLGAPHTQLAAGQHGAAGGPGGHPAAALPLPPTCLVPRPASEPSSPCACLDPTTLGPTAAPTTHLLGTAPGLEVLLPLVSPLLLGAPRLRPLRPLVSPLGTAAWRGARKGGWVGGWGEREKGGAV